MLYILKFFKMESLIMLTSIAHEISTSEFFLL